MQQGTLVSSPGSAAQLPLLQSQACGGTPSRQRTAWGRKGQAAASRSPPELAPPRPPPSLPRIPASLPPAAQHQKQQGASTKNRTAGPGRIRCSPPLMRRPPVPPVPQPRLPVRRNGPPPAPPPPQPAGQAGQRGEGGGEAHSAPHCLQAGWLARQYAARHLQTLCARIRADAAMLLPPLELFLLAGSRYWPSSSFEQMARPCHSHRSRPSQVRRSPTLPQRAQHQHGPTGAQTHPPAAPPPLPPPEPAEPPHPAPPLGWPAPQRACPARRPQGRPRCPPPTRGGAAAAPTLPAPAARCRRGPGRRWRRARALQSPAASLPPPTSARAQLPACGSLGRRGWQSGP